MGNSVVPNIIGECGEQVLNNNQERTELFAITNNLNIKITFIGKQDINKYTWNVRGFRSILDYVLINE